jgi:phosphatidylserine/phosphatidylglycerophosphate/cardiolipin synthase-like enzyme
LFEKRLNSGVLIDVLGRPDGRSGNEYLAFSKYFAYQPGIQFFNWYQPSVEDPFRSQTFHFKAAIVDNGAKAYLGSANMTVSGLRSRMELGVILEGRSAKNLSKVLDSVLSIASKV